MVTISAYGHEMKNLKEIIPKTIIDSFHYVFADDTDIIESKIESAYYIIVPENNCDINCDSIIDTEHVYNIIMDVEYFRYMNRGKPCAFEVSIKYRCGISVYYKVPLSRELPIEESDSILHRLILFYAMTGCNVIHSFSSSSSSMMENLGMSITNESLLQSDILTELYRDYEHNRFHSVLESWLSRVGIESAIDACQKYNQLELLMFILRLTEDDPKDTVKLEL